MISKLQAEFRTIPKFRSPSWSVGYELNHWLREEEEKCTRAKLSQLAHRHFCCEFGFLDLGGGARYRTMVYSEKLYKRKELQLKQLSSPTSSSPLCPQRVSRFTD